MPLRTEPRPRGHLLVAGVLLALVAAAFAPVGGNGFVSLDDGIYLTENPAVLAGLTTRGLAWAFTTFHAGNWHPLTWVSHMLDVELLGLQPGPHHAVNVLLHAAAAVGLFVALRRLTGSLWCSALAVSLFALHPLRVESVAWAAQRKDVLSGFFFSLALLGYAGYVRRPSGSGSIFGFILLGGLGALAMFRQLSVWEAGILAVILAPTHAGLVIGYLHDRFIHVSIEMLVSRKKTMDPGGFAWSAGLAATRSPAPFA